MSGGMSQRMGSPRAKEPLDFAGYLVDNLTCGAASKKRAC